MKKILIIDDEEEILELTQRRLKRYGYEVVSAGDGETGFNKAVSEQPNLILLDIIMPNKDGFTVLKELKANDVTSRIPVIMLTAKSESTTIFEGQKFGAIDYFIKPCNWEELVKYIKKYIDLTSDIA